MKTKMAVRMQQDPPNDLLTTILDKANNKHKKIMELANARMREITDETESRMKDYFQVHVKNDLLNKSPHVKALITSMLDRLDPTLPEIERLKKEAEERAAAAEQKGSDHSTPASENASRSPAPESSSEQPTRKRDRAESTAENEPPRKRAHHN